MSLVKYLIISIILIACLAFSFNFFKPKSSNLAVRNSQITQSGFTSKGVVNRTIEINLEFKSPESEFAKTEIVANVSLPFTFDEKLYYRWYLSEGVILKEGQLVSEVTGLTQNAIKKISITVSGFSKEHSRQIKFEIYGFKNRQKIYGDAIISSNVESTFENTVQNVERIKASE